MQSNCLVAKMNGSVKFGLGRTKSTPCLPLMVSENNNNAVEQPQASRRNPPRQMPVWRPLGDVRRGMVVGGTGADGWWGKGGQRRGGGGVTCGMG